jgi:ubiquinone/menaquinone biosynthesis C-methylase UbiE
VKDDYPSDVQQSFNKWAPLYGFVDMLACSLREKVFNFTSPPKGAKILDVCTGTGRQAFAFGRKGFDVIGIDLSEGMLRKAVREKGYENVRFVISNAEELPFKDDHFDVTCISFGLHEMPNLIRKKVLQEMDRVTKTKGKIIIVDYALPRGKIKKSLFYHFVRLYESRYFPEFIKTDLQKTIQGAGLKFNGACEWAFGGVKIWKYEKAKV